MDPILVTEILTSQAKTRRLSSFIRKLWFILSNEEDFNELIHWADDGQVVCIPNSVKFSSNILPKLFKHNNWHSFIRQLNLYGFRKVYLSNNLQKEEQKEVWYFRHENFKKDNPELLHNIERHTNKTETDDTRQQIAKKTQQASGYEEELKEINSKLEVATEKSEGLKNYVKELYTVQMNQQEEIDNILSTMSSMVEDQQYPTSSRFAGILKRISYANEMNKTTFQRRPAFESNTPTEDNIARSERIGVEPEISAQSKRKGKQKDSTSIQSDALNEYASGSGERIHITETSYVSLQPSTSTQSSNDEAEDPHLEPNSTDSIRLPPLKKHRK